MMSVRLYQSIPNAKPSFDTCSSSAQVVTVSHCVDRKGANTKASHTQFVAVSKLMNGAFGLIARSFAMLHQGSRFASLGSDTVLPTVCLAVTNMSSLFGSQLVLGFPSGLHAWRRMPRTSVSLLWRRCDLRTYRLESLVVLS